MNRRVALVLSPCAALLLGILTLGAGRIPALLLFPAASLAALSLGVFLHELPVKKNLLRKSVAVYLLTIFNVLLIASIVVEVLALFTLFELIEPDLWPQVTGFIWALAALLIASQIGVILERRINTARPRLQTAPMVVVAIITAFNVFVWSNALLLEYTDFLFFTGIELAAHQAIYLLLTGATLQAVGAMIAFRVPTLFEIIFFRPVNAGKILALTSASPMIFTLAFTGLVLLGSFIFVSAAGWAFGLGGILPGNVGLRLLVVFPIALVTFFLVAGFLSYQRTRTRYHIKMDARQKVAIAAGIFTALVALLLFYFAFRLGQGLPVRIAGVRLADKLWVEFLVAGMLTATAPIGLYVQTQNRNLQLLEERLSDFLRDLAETSKAGLPLHQSLESAALKDYGPLTSEIERMSHQCSWGLSFAEAFRRFGDRTKSRVVKRAANLVVETSVSGGNTSDILAATAADIHQQKAMEEDRRTAMSTYIAVIYIVFFVFLAVLGVLSSMFLPSMLSATQAANEAGATSALFQGSKVNLDAMKDAFFHALLVQAFGNGLIAGMIRDGSVGSGMKHVSILVVISYAAYRLLLG